MPVFQLTGPESARVSEAELCTALGWLLKAFSADGQSPTAYAVLRRLPAFAAEIMAGLLEMGHGDVAAGALPMVVVLVKANLLSVAGRHDEASNLLASQIATSGQNLNLDNARYSVQCRARGISDDLSERFCSWPFERFDVVGGGGVHLCCAAWLPVAVGNLQAQPWSEIWNGDKAQALRQSVLDGSFRYCNKMICPRIQQGLPAKHPNDGEVPPQPARIDLSFDPTCNLSCPSCRTQMLSLRSDVRELMLKFVDERVLPLLEGASSVNITGSGDPFASKLFRHLLRQLDANRFPSLKVLIATNGVLFTRNEWEDIQHLAGRVGRVGVSVDAARPETYAQVRRGGDWERLWHNLAFIAELRRSQAIDRFTLAFVVQAANWREIPAFVTLARQLEVDAVHFSCVQNWGTWTPAEFAAQAVHLPNHPDHAAFCQSLLELDPDDPMLSLGDIEQYRPDPSKASLTAEVRPT